MGLLLRSVWVALCVTHPRAIFMAVKVHIKEITSHAPLTRHTDTLISPGGISRPVLG